MSERLYTPNNMRRIPYAIDYIDPWFKNWLIAMGGISKYMDEWSSLVTTGTRVDSQADSLPTGGRVVVYKLPKPFMDPILKQPITEIDVKGVGLTKSGYIQDGKNLETDRHVEIAAHKKRKDLYGPESLIEARASVTNQNMVRRQGQFVPIPLAVIKPEKLIYKGELIDSKEVAKKFRLPPNESDFALLIRGYIQTTTRIADLFNWRAEKGCTIEKCVTPKFFHEVKDPNGTIARARALFRNFEMTKVGAFDGIDWYNKMQIMIAKQLAIQIITGYTPCSGRESSEGQSQLRHTHLQNRTVAGMNIEFAPATDMRRLPEDRLRNHMVDIFMAEVDFLASLGVVCLPESRLKDGLVMSEDYYDRMEKLLPNNKHIKFLEDFKPKSEKEIQREIDAGKKVVIVCSRSRGDEYSRFLGNRT